MPEVFTLGDVVKGVWTPGVGNYWDRIGAFRAAVAAQGGIGGPSDTDAVKMQRLRAVESLWVEWAQQDPNDFISYVFEDSATGEPMRQAQMHYEIQKSWTEDPYNVTRAYRGSGKTTQMEGRVIWTLGDNPNKFFKVVCEGKEQSLERVRNIKNHIEHNPKVRRVFPRLLPHPAMPWSDHSITVIRTVRDRNPSVGAWGYKASGVGGRCHYLVGDDAVPPSAMSSEADRVDNIRRWKNVWSKMLFKNARVWFLCTPWHEKDLGNDLATNKKFTLRHYAVNGPPDFTNTHAPHHWPPDKLKEIFERDGSLSYDRSHRLITMSAGSSLFPPKLFAMEGVMRHDLRMRMPWRYWQNLGVQRYMGVDLALSAEGGKGDWFVIFVWGVDQNGNMYVVDIIRKKSDDYLVQLQWIKDAYVRYMPDMVFIEGTQFQRVYSDIVRRSTNIPVKPFYPLGKGSAKNNPGAEKTNLLHGIPGMRIMFENGKVRIPRGDDYSIEAGDIWIDELQHIAFTELGKVEGVGAHDDTVSASWVGYHAAAYGGSLDLSPSEAHRQKTDIEALGATESDGTGLEDIMRRGLPETPSESVLRLSTHTSSRTQAQVPVKLTPGDDPNQGVRAPDDYDEIYTSLDVSRRSDALGILHLSDGGKVPTMKQMLDGGLPPRSAGGAAAAFERYTIADVRYVLWDLAQEHIEGIVALGGAAPGEDEDQYGDDLMLGEGMGARLPGGAFMPLG